MRRPYFNIPGVQFLIFNETLVLWGKTLPLLQRLISVVPANEERYLVDVSELKLFLNMWSGTTSG